MDDNEKMMDQSLASVRAMIVASLKDTALASIVEEFEGIASGGKMLRARLAIRIGRATGVNNDLLLRAAAAVEVMHAASLLHDDVIDGGELRRGAPAFWTQRGAPGSILLGDLFVCKAIGYLSNVAEGKLMTPFIEFASEMCEAEVEQELMMRDKDMSWEQTVSVARRKTGSLFAFAAFSAAGEDEELQAALSECGYAIGTAYQLADDILDAYGDAESSDKTLGKDAERQKSTAASICRLENIDPISYIENFSEESSTRLEKWPQLQEAWDEYYHRDIGPAMNQFIEKFSLETV